MAELKMLRQVMTTTELFSHGEAICDMLRDQYGTYDADSLEEVLVDETFIQRLKTKGYEVFGEGDPRAERTAPRRPLPRMGLPASNRPREESTPRMPVPRNGVANRPANERPTSGPTRPVGSSTPFRPSTGDGTRPSEGVTQTSDSANNAQRPMRNGGLPLRPAERPAVEQTAPGTAHPVPEVPTAEVPELPAAAEPAVQAELGAGAEAVEPSPTSETVRSSEQPTPSAEVLAQPPVVEATPLVEVAPVVEEPLADRPTPQPAEPVVAEAAPAPATKPKTAPKKRTPTPKADAAPIVEGSEAPAPKPRRTTRKRVEPTEE